MKKLNKGLFITTDIPSYNFDPNDVAARTKIIKPRQMKVVMDNHQQPDEEYERMQGGINRNLEDVCKKTGAILIPLHLVLKQCDMYMFFDVQDEKHIPLYRDANHLSTEGSLRAAQFILPYVFPETALQDRPLINP